MTQLWADKPFELLDIPGEPGAPSCNNEDVMSTAVEMANVHNLILRGLNSIYLQAPKISKPVDVADFMLYIIAWADTVHHHHSVEESMFFPEIEKIAQEVGHPEKLMDANIDQHHAFEAKLVETSKYAQAVSEGKEEFDSARLKELIDGFAPILTQHLHDEIDTLMKLEGCDGKRVKKAMKDCAEAGAKTADPNLVIPLVLGCIDKTYPGSADFPPLPFFVPYLNAYWFSKKHKGCWRFNPSDQWGKPRPLQFL
ncbi:hypothetical protein ACN47E_007330 [Coniothyrium glycines]